MIELLVVIAIIGILAAIVLASLGTARQKGTVASVKGQMHAARNAGELFFTANSSSYGVAGTSNATAGANCGTTVAAANSTLFSDTASNMASIISSITNVNGVGAANVDCGDSIAAWSVAVALPGGGFWCVDNRGTARSASSAGTTYTNLTVTGTPAHLTAGATVCN